MNIIRILMSFFLVVLLVLSIAGWIWAGGGSTPQPNGARLVLALCGLTSVGSLYLLWRTKWSRTPEGA